MALYLPEVGHLNGTNAAICSHMAGSSSSGTGNLFELSGGLSKLILHNRAEKRNTTSHYNNTN